MKICCYTLCLAAACLIHVAQADDVDELHPTNATQNAAITLEIKNAFAANDSSQLREVVVTTGNDGKVVLSGTVATQAAIDKAGEIASHVIGVNSVSNQILLTTR